VGGYYEEADAPVAGYLAARGWTGTSAPGEQEGKAG